MTSVVASKLHARIQTLATLPSTQFAEYSSHGTGLLNTVALRVLDAEFVQLIAVRCVSQTAGYQSGYQALCWI